MSGPNAAGWISGFYPQLKVVASDTYITAVSAPIIHRESETLSTHYFCYPYMQCRNTLHLSNRIILCRLQSRQATLGVVWVQG